VTRKVDDAMNAQVLVKVFLLAAAAVMPACSGGAREGTSSQAGHLSRGSDPISITASPSVLVLSPGSTASFTISATGSGGYADLGLTDPPYGVSEDTTIFLPLGGSIDVDVWVDPDAPAQNAVQTFTATVFDGNQFVDYQTSVQFIINATGGSDDGGQVDGGQVDASDAGAAE
jgi:hypothetical protein